MSQLVTKILKIVSILVGIVLWSQCFSSRIEQTLFDPQNEYHFLVCIKINCWLDTGIYRFCHMENYQTAPFAFSKPLDIVEHVNCLYTQGINESIDTKY